MSVLRGSEAGFDDADVCADRGVLRELREHWCVDPALPDLGADRAGSADNDCACDDHHGSGVDDHDRDPRAAYTTDRRR
jgi:hypothetical protein